MRSTRLALPAALAAALLLASCSDADTPLEAAPEPPPYETSEAITARVLPRIASVGEEAEAADDAAWVIEATVEDAGEGHEVRLLAADGDDWETVAEAETDGDGIATLTTTTDGELHVVTDPDLDAAPAAGAAGKGGKDGQGKKAGAGSDDAGSETDDAETDDAEAAVEEVEDIGTPVSTDDIDEPSFSDEFDEDRVDEGEDSLWETRQQGYAGVRQCSQALPEASEVVDGVLRLSVLDDPDAGTCDAFEDEVHDYRLNGHVGTEGNYDFTYGVAAARVRFHSERGQHGSFWMQAPDGHKAGGPEEGGAEIDVIEYFGDGHPEGGLTSFTYWFDDEGELVKQGGWIEDADQYGGDWAEEFHVFSVEWTPEEYIFRIDGKISQRLEGPTSGTPEFLVLSLLSSDYELKHSTELPQVMEVDWVQVWED